MFIEQDSYLGGVLKNSNKVKTINGLTPQEWISETEELILNSNNIYLIDSGKVISNGKHEELIEKSELYKSFYEKQIQK